MKVDTTDPTVFVDVDDDSVVLPRPARGAELPKRIAGYRIVRELGRGGMGTVFEAEPDHPDQPGRRVALKVMRYGIASRALSRRFEHESQLLARMEHPGIARVFAAGTHVPAPGDGGIGPVPFFVMEYVDGGVAITEYAARERLPIAARITLFLEVLDAVDHGHRRGVIHRDLKPANILVDRHGRPKVIDYGVARRLASDPNGSTIQTEIGQILGTVQYMSPEQLEGDPTRVDARTDLYALGVVLFELLCGKLPYDVRRRTIVEASRIVREDPPDRPGTAREPLGVDLETIVLKLLEKDPTHRYVSARSLADDLRRAALRPSTPPDASSSAGSAPSVVIDAR